MSSLLAVDPGTSCVGWSLWGDAMEACGLVRTKAKELGDRGHDLSGQLPTGDFHTVVELPRVYPYHKKLRPNDLIDLAFVGGMCGCRGTSASMVHPVTWKGQLPKDISHRRIIEQLSHQELLIVKEALAKVPKSLKHNVLDAVGIGLWHRTGKKL